MLRLTRTSAGSLDLTGVTPDRLAKLSALEAAMLPVWCGDRPEPLGDHFAVSGDPADGHLLFTGDLSGVRGLGAEMTGGRIEVHGPAGDGCGAARPGARRGMSGGVIVVRGDVGVECGAVMRRGLIVVEGACGEFAGAGMVAGTLVAGKLGRRAGAGLKRGTLVAEQVEEGPSGFRHCCDYRPAFAGLLAAELRRAGVAADWLAAGVRCFRGDVLTGGNGELLLPDRSPKR